MAWADKIPISLCRALVRTGSRGSLNPSILRLHIFEPITFGTLYYAWSGFCGPWNLRSSDRASLIWDITSSPRGVEPPSTKPLELQTAWDGILWPILS